MKKRIEDTDSKYIVGGIAAILIIGIVSGSLYLQQETEETDQLQVMATFYPFYDISSNIGGDDVEFSTLVPPGTDPHDFDPSPQDVSELENADIFIVTGAEFEEWEKDLVDQVGNETVIVDPSEEIELLHADETPDAHDDHGDEHEHEEENGHEHEHEEENGHEHDGEHDHSHGQYDPHYWLSPQNAIVVAEKFGEEIQQEDEENAEIYQENMESYISKLEQLDSDYEETLTECNQDTILITHPAFAYLGQDYGFEQVQTSGIGHLTEPSPQELENLVEEAETNELQYIFYDPITEATAAETIASELSEEGEEVETLPLHSIEAVENPEEETFITLMEQNLDNLEIALECQ